MKTNRDLKISICLLGILATTACGSPGSNVSTPQEAVPGTEILGSTSLDSFQADPNRKAFETKVCSPMSDDFGPRGNGAARSGLVGVLKYLKASQTRYNNVSDYIKNGTVVPADIYLDQLFVPTRAWSKGFAATDGSILKDEMGKTLFENFSLELEGRVRLGTGDEPGAYQFALLADDGAVMRIPLSDGTYHTLVDDDGTHPTKMACSSTTLFFDNQSRFPIKVDYYQGPRYHIALTLMWRKVTDTSKIEDPLCGKSGNDLFFNSATVPSTPQTAYKDLLARGWKPLTAENFSLPRWALDNPCDSASGDLPIVK